MVKLIQTRNIAAAWVRKNYHYLNYIAEDFAQDYCLRQLNGKKQTLRQAFIDFLRKEFGESRNPNSKKAFEVRDSSPNMDNLKSNDHFAGEIEINNLISVLKLNKTQSKILIELMQNARCADIAKDRGCTLGNIVRFRTQIRKKFQSLFMEY